MTGLLSLRANYIIRRSFHKNRRNGCNSGYLSEPLFRVKSYLKMGKNYVYLIALSCGLYYRRQITADY